VTRILLVGCGKMGGALLAGWSERAKGVSDVVVIEPVGQVAARAGVSVVKSSAEVPPSFRPEVVVLAVKPQTMDAALASLAPYRDAVYLSIAAGRTLASFARALGAEAAVVRAMPNTPAAIGRGITVAVPNPHVDARQREACGTLLAAGGEVAWIDDETLMDAVTAVSGSGPAYVFLLAEALGEAGEAAGLPKALAARLARATVSGSGELLYRSPESPATLRENVTSPRGTTFAALQILRGEGGLAALLRHAVAAAAARSRELAN